MRRVAVSALLLLHIHAAAFATTMFKQLDRDNILGAWFALDWESGFVATMIVGRGRSSLSLTGGEGMGEFVFDLSGVEVRKGVMHFVATSKRTGLIMRGTAVGGADSKGGEVTVKMKKVNADNPNELIVKEFVFLKLDSVGDRMKRLSNLMNRAGELAKGSAEPCCAGGRSVIVSPAVTETPEK